MSTFKKEEDYWERLERLEAEAEGGKSNFKRKLMTVSKPSSKFHPKDKTSSKSSSMSSVLGNKHRRATAATTTSSNNSKMAKSSLMKDKPTAAAKITARRSAAATLIRSLQPQYPRKLGQQQEQKKQQPPQQPQVKNKTEDLQRRKNTPVEHGRHATPTTMAPTAARAVAKPGGSARPPGSGTVHRNNSISGEQVNKITRKPTGDGNDDVEVIDVTRDGGNGGRPISASDGGRLVRASPGSQPRASASSRPAVGRRSSSDGGQVVTKPSTSSGVADLLATMLSSPAAAASAFSHSDGGGGKARGGSAARPNSKRRMASSESDLGLDHCGYITPSSKHRPVSGHTTGTISTIQQRSSSGGTRTNNPSGVIGAGPLSGRSSSSTGSSSSGIAAVRGSVSGGLVSRPLKMAKVGSGDSASDTRRIVPGVSERPPPPPQLSLCPVGTAGRRGEGGRGEAKKEPSTKLRRAD